MQDKMPYQAALLTVGVFPASPWSMLIDCAACNPMLNPEKIAVVVNTPHYQPALIIILREVLQA